VNTMGIRVVSAATTNGPSFFLKASTLASAVCCSWDFSLSGSMIARFDRVRDGCGLAQVFRTAGSSHLDPSAGGQPRASFGQFSFCNPSRRQLRRGHCIVQANPCAGLHDSEQASLPILPPQHRKAEFADKACWSLDDQAQIALVRHQDLVRPSTPAEQGGLP